MVSVSLASFGFVVGNSIVILYRSFYVCYVIFLGVGINEYSDIRIVKRDTKYLSCLVVGVCVVCDECVSVLHMDSTLTRNECD